MKYVKLFESWLNTINEELTKGQLSPFNLKYDETEKPTIDGFAKSVANRINEMFAKASEFKIELEPKTKLKKITLSVKDNPQNYFEFDFDLKTFQPETIKGEPYIIGIVGKANVDRVFKNETTLAQFIDSVITGAELTEYKGTDDYQIFIDAAEKIVYIAKNNQKPKVSPSMAKSISKMSAKEFFALPEKSKIQLFSTVLKGQFVFHKTRKNDLFVVTPSQELAKKYKLEHSTKGDETSRYLTVRIAKPDDLNESMANIPVAYGGSDVRSDYAQDIYNPMDATKVNKILVPDNGKDTTLAAFIFDLLEIASTKGMKYESTDAKGKKVAVDIKNSMELATAVTVDNSEETKKKASDAWTKKGGSADMTLRAEASKEATA